MFPVKHRRFFLGGAVAAGTPRRRRWNFCVWNNRHKEAEMVVGGVPLADIEWRP